MWYNPRHEVNRLDTGEVESNLVSYGVTRKEEDQDSAFRWFFLGTVMGLTPSGKYYLPWACSNVEVCKECAESTDFPCTVENPCDREGAEGSGHCEACLDAAFWAQLNEDLEDINAWAEPSEDCPTDIFVVCPWDDNVKPGGSNEAIATK